MEKCESLGLNYHKTSGSVYISETPEALAKSLDIRLKDATELWEIYWSAFNQS